MAQPVKFYFDLLSQPCRALYMFFEAARIPYEPMKVNLIKGEHLTDEFQKINRFQKVPVIIDNDLKLSESVAIFRHLVREKLVPDHWYPNKTPYRAQIDEYLEWQHMNMRLYSIEYFRTTFLLPKVTNTQPDPAKVKKASKKMEKCLNDFEKFWLRGDDYLFGSQISIADLLAICEIDQPKTVGFDPFKNRNKLAKWHELVRETMNPFYENSLQRLEKMTKPQTETPSSNL